MSSTTLSEFLKDREAQLKRQIADMRVELRQVRAARGVVESQDDAGGEAGRTEGGQTIKEMVRRVLKDRPAGETAEEIIRLVKATFDHEVPRASMSPQLSRLKADGELLFDQGTKRWSLSEYTKTGGAEANGRLAEI